MNNHEAINKAIVFLKDIKRVGDSADQKKTSFLVNIPFERAFNIDFTIAALEKQREMGPCEYCKGKDQIWAYKTREYSHHRVKCCPDCGYRLDREPSNRKDD